MCTAKPCSKYELKRIFPILIVILSCFGHYRASAVTHQSVRHGIWTDPSTWSTNLVPGDGDSIFVNHEVLVGGTYFQLNDVYLNVTDSGCLCGVHAEAVLDNSEYINSGHTSFISLTLQNNSEGFSSGVLLLTQFVMTTSNSTMTIQNGIEITPENDLTCRCADSVRLDSLNELLDSTSIQTFSFENELGDDTVDLCRGDSIILKLRDSVFYEWSNGDLTYYTIPESPGWISVMLTEGNDTVRDSLFVRLDEYITWPFPNVFTPNADQTNDAIEFGTSAGMEFRLYNRWGRQVYQYDGTALHFDGKNFPDGIYFYQIEFGTPCKNEFSEQKGWLQITR